MSMNNPGEFERQLWGPPASEDALNTLDFTALELVKELPWVVLLREHEVREGDAIALFSYAECVDPGDGNVNGQADIHLARSVDKDRMLTAIELSYPYHDLSNSPYGEISDADQLEESAQLANILLAGTQLEPDVRQLIQETADFVEYFKDCGLLQRHVRRANWAAKFPPVDTYNLIDGIIQRESPQARRLKEYKAPSDGSRLCIRISDHAPNGQDDREASLPEITMYIHDTQKDLAYNYNRPNQEGPMLEIVRPGEDAATGLVAQVEGQLKAAEIEAIFGAKSLHDESLLPRGEAVERLTSLLIDEIAKNEVTELSLEKILTE